MREITRVIVHHSDSPYGCVSVFRGWHIYERGWADIGYHCVIDNGYLAWGLRYDARMDGAIEMGRPWQMIGSHVKGHNADTLGICLVGKGQFSAKQMASLKSLLLDLRAQFGPIAILGHRDLGQTDCPGFSVREWCQANGL